MSGFSFFRGTAAIRWTASGLFPGLVLFCALIATGCIGKQVRPLNGPKRSYPFHATEAHSRNWLKADSLWELRADASAARRSLEEYRKAAKKQKKVPELFARLSHACYFVATYHEPSSEKRDRLFREGQSSAEAGMSLHPGYREVYRETGDEVEAARELDSAFVEVLYWYVVNLGRELNQETVIVRRGNKARLESLNGYLMRLNPSVYYAGPHRIAGVIPTRLPEGDLKAAKAHFDSAIALAPLYLGNRVAYADFYAVRARDKQAFMSQLSLVAAAQADTLPEIGPENRLAQKRAKALLAMAESLFP